MGFQAILILLFAFSAVQTVCGQVWHFGQDNNPVARVTTDYAGRFKFLQKEQNIQLDVQPCSVVSYVRVQVDNKISSPSVYYDEERNVVTIKYGFWQHSLSTFSILAKAVFLQGCVPPSGPQQQILPPPQQIVIPQQQIRPPPQELITPRQQLQSPPQQEIIPQQEILPPPLQ